MRTVLRAVEFLLVNLCKRDHVRRIEHAKLDPSGEEANQRGIESAFGQKPLLHSIDIGFLDGLAKSRSESHALIVHAANDRDRRTLRLGRTITMICGNISDRVTVRHNVSLETPLAAQLILQQKLVGACRL